MVESWAITVEEKFCCDHGTCWTEQGSISLKEKLVEYSFGAMMKKNGGEELWRDDEKMVE